MICTVDRVQALSASVFRMELCGSFPDMRPGQFAGVQVPGKYLRRPISLCDFDSGRISLVIRAVGDGTRALRAVLPGERLDVLCPLGNGFDTQKSGMTPLLVGGGVGLPPLYALCRRLIAQGKRPAVIAGFACAGDAFLTDAFLALGAQVQVTTVDGSLGVRGMVTDAMPESGYSYLYACGPKAMMRAVCEKAGGVGEYSLEERMGCGFGACMGCAVRTVGGMKRVCADGPVFPGKEILW